MQFPLVVRRLFIPGADIGRGFAHVLDAPRESGTQGFEFVDFLLLFVYRSVQGIEQIILAREPDFEVDQAFFATHDAVFQNAQRALS